MQTSHFPLRYLQGSCKNGGHLRVWDRLWIFSKKLDVGHQQLTKALKNLALPRKGGSGIVTFVRPHQSFFRGQLVKVVGEVLTCCLRYGRPMDKGIPWGPPVKNSLIREGPAAPKKNLVSLFFVAMRNLYPFFLTENLPIFEFDFLEADFFLLPFEPLGGSFLWVSFITCPPIFLPEGSALPFLKPTKDQVSFLALFVFSRHHLPPRKPSK